MKKLFIILVLLLISYTLTFGIDKIDGYKKYKFGMTLSEADSLYDNDKIVDSKYVGVDKELTREIEIYGEVGILSVRFKDDYGLVNIFYYPSDTL